MEGWEEYKIKINNNIRCLSYICCRMHFHSVSEDVNIWLYFHDKFSKLQFST